MSTAIQRRRGTKTQNEAFTGQLGEWTHDTTLKTVRVHDGATVGGFPLTRMDQLAVNVKLYGAVGDGVTDDTDAIQECLDENLSVYFPPGNYAVTQITFDQAGASIDMRNASLVGIAAVATSSCVELKAGVGTQIWGLKVTSNQNTNYTAGIHWYTNDLNLYNPGHLRVYGCFTGSFLNGLVIGALPSQADPIPAQNTVNAAGVASDAPLSESVIYGFYSQNCVRAVFMRQPNGKVTLAEPEIQGECLQWSGQDANCTALAVTNAGSELTVIGGACEQNQSSTGAFLQITNGNVRFFGTTIETKAPSYIAGAARVEFIGCLDMGWNNLTYWPFNVQAAATGRILFADCAINLAEGNYAAGGRVFIKAVADTSYGFSPNLGFIAEFRNCELRDFTLDGVTEYLPLVLGVRVRFAECHLSSYTSGARTISQRLRMSRDVLAGAFDQTGNSFSAYPQTGTPTTEAGMTFTINVAGSQWGAESSSLPTVEGETISRAIRLKGAASSGYASAQSAVVAITPGVPLLLTGFIKTGTGAAINLVRVLFFKFDGTTAASTANQDAIACQESGIGSTWQTMAFVVTPPADCSKVALFLYAQNGSELQVANVSLWQ
jgi:hypothetical protein